MIDIHSHFLFGIDDGSKNQLQTIDMLHQAEEAGITDLVATPHVNELANVGYLEQISENLKNIRKIIKNKNLNLRIHRGSEIIFDTKIIDWLDYHELLIGKEQKYVLFEVPLFIDLSKISQLIFDIQLKNIIPIFAHPERSNKIQDSPEILEAWVNQG